MNDQKPASDENQIVAERRAKLAALRARGVAFPNDFKRQHLAKDLQLLFAKKNKDEIGKIPPDQRRASVAGRMMLKRLMGKASFATLQDMSGRIQLFIADDSVGPETHEAFKHFDIGDIVAAEGVLFRTKTGELSVRVENVRLLAKSLRPLPEKFHGLTDQEQKYRARYLDLITNDNARQVFITRSRIIQTLREFFVARGYLEVETPMMHAIPGGAAARPFVTHHNALDMRLYLRIAPELYLKRLVVGGFEKVFEINRNFRNEGISTRHNPEFTMLEFYEAYRDYRYLMDLTEVMLRKVAETALGTMAFTYQGREIDFGKPFSRLNLVEALRTHAPEYQNVDLGDGQFIRGELKKRGVDVSGVAGLGSLHLSLFEATVEPKLWQPTFIVDYPTEVSPLARASDNEPWIAERFELFIAGREIANGFSELNDPEDQSERFMEQAEAKDAGDFEAMHYDADYIRALEYGLPPTAGEGVGIDRLVMLLTDSASIRDVILFPQMRATD